jgi:hypothetical protein
MRAYQQGIHVQPYLPRDDVRLRQWLERYLRLQQEEWALYTLAAPNGHESSLSGRWLQADDRQGGYCWVVDGEQTQAVPAVVAILEQWQQAQAPQWLGLEIRPMSITVE